MFKQIIFSCIVCLSIPATAMRLASATQHVKPLILLQRAYAANWVGDATTHYTNEYVDADAIRVKFKDNKVTQAEFERIVACGKYDAETLLDLCRPIYAKEVEIKFEKGNNLRDSFVLPMSILSSLAGAPLCAIGGALTTTHVIDHFPLWMVAPSSIGFIGFTYFFLMQKRVNNQIRNHPQTAKLSHLAYLCEKEELENYRRKAGFNHPLISGKGGHHD